MNYFLTCSVRRSLSKLWSSHNWRIIEETERRNPLKERLLVGGNFEPVGRGSTCNHTSR